jgi:hypothetical protein
MGIGLPSTSCDAAQIVPRQCALHRLAGQREVEQELGALHSVEVGEIVLGGPIPFDASAISLDVRRLDDGARILCTAWNLDARGGVERS